MNESEFVRILESFYDSKTGGEKTFRLGKISPTYTSGLPKVLLDGDDGVGDVTYPHLFSYVPSANDRVLLIRFGTSYLILGKINNDGSPSGGGEFNGTIDWGNVTGKPSTFSPSAHTHSWLDVTGKPTTFTPSAHTHSISDVDNLQTELDGKASSSHTHSWSSITSKPSTFAPSAHSHSISEVTGLQTALDGKASTSHSHSWSDITSKPSTFTPSAHTHSVSDLTNFPTQTGNSGKFLTTNGTTLSWATVATSSGDWADITNKPTTFPPSAHTHAWSEITGKPTTFTPSTHTHAWADITGKPTTFTPSTHTHTVSQVSDFPSQTNNTGKLLTTNGTTLSWTSFTLEGMETWNDVLGKPNSISLASHTHDWIDVTGKPTTFTPSSHNHHISDVTGLQTALDGKSATGHSHSWSEITGKPSTFTPSSHTHAISDVTNLQTTLDGKSDSGHTHSWSSITSKPTTFPPSSHSHSISDVTNLQTELNSKATLGSGINGVLTHDYGYFYLKKYNTSSSHSGFGQMARIYYSGASSTNSIYFQVVKDDNSVTYAKLVALSFDLSSKEENKKDIVELEDGMLDKILQAKAYKYRFRDADDGRDRLGLVIGRETPEEVISAGGETVDIYSFATMLMKAMQEQQEQIEDLKRRLDELERG